MKKLLIFMFMLICMMSIVYGFLIPLSPEEITTSTAKIKGYYSNPDSFPKIVAFGQYKLTDTSTWTSSPTETFILKPDIHFEGYALNLVEDTTYDYRFCVDRYDGGDNKISSSCSSIIQFKSAKSYNTNAPIINTLDVTNIDTTTATLNSEVTDLKGYPYSSSQPVRIFWKYRIYGNSDWNFQTPDQIISSTGTYFNNIFSLFPNFVKYETVACIKYYEQENTIWRYLEECDEENIKSFVTSPLTEEDKYYYLLQSIGNYGTIIDIAYSPNDEKLAVLSLLSPYIYILETDNNYNLMYSLSHLGFTTLPYKIDFSPNGNYLAIAGGWEDNLYILDTSDYSLLYNISINNEVIDDVAFSPNNQILAVGTFETNPDKARMSYYDVSNSFSLLSSASSTSTNFQQHQPRARGLSWTGNSDYISVAGGQEDIWIYRFDGGTAGDSVENIVLEDFYDSERTSFSNDGNKLAIVDSEGLLYVYDTSNILVSNPQIVNISVTSNNLYDVKFSNDDTFIAVASRNPYKVFIYDANTYELLQELDDMLDSVYQINFNSDDSLIAVGSDKVYIYGDSPITELSLFSLPATDITPNSFKLNSEFYFDTGSNDTMIIFFRYKKTGQDWINIEGSVRQSILGITQFFSKDLTGLSLNTNYQYQVCGVYNFETICSDNIIDVKTLSEPDGIFIPPPTAGDTDLDELWNVLLGGSTFAKMLMAFFLIMAITFIGMSGVGKAGMNAGALGILIFVFLGVVLSTMLGLIPIYVLLLFIIAPLIFIIIKSMMGRGE